MIIHVNQAPSQQGDASKKVNVKAKIEAKQANESLESPKQQDREIDRSSHKAESKTN